MISCIELIQLTLKSIKVIIRKIDFIYVVICWYFFSRWPLRKGTKKKSVLLIRLGTGLAYSIVYSTLLVKLVFLVSLNSGVYLPATYQEIIYLNELINPIPRNTQSQLILRRGGLKEPPLTSSFLKIKTWNLVTMFIFKFRIEFTSSTMPDFWLDNRLFVEFMYFRS